jgi:hypothetical protein
MARPFCPELGLAWCRDGDDAVLPRPLALLADDTRLKILWALMQGEHHVDALAAIVCDDHISRIGSLLVDHTSEEIAAQAQVSALLARTATTR